MNIHSIFNQIKKYSPQKIKTNLLAFLLCENKIKFYTFQANLKFMENEKHFNYSAVGQKVNVP